ncbi:hypothetical protein [Nocardia carnea]|uniref:hypothetical protein n=1 Tax=Nocardia carnea TaxID=37328 RepID=UPI002453A8EE|nr:hypothetical protein [Nocardia carnea]
MLSSIEIDGIGRLSHLGRSKHWTGQLQLACADEPVELYLAGTPAGPTVAQVEAIVALVANSVTLRQDAEAGLADLLVQAELAPTPVWEVFDFAGIEVPHESYDANAIHVLVGLEQVDFPDEFRPAIDVVNGTVVQVLSGT